MSRDPRDIVREGYDALAPRYLQFRLDKPGADLAIDWVRSVTEGEEFGGSTHPFIRAHRL